MKKMLLPFLGILLLAGCEKEAATPINGETDTAVEFRRSNAKIDVCHYDDENDTWEVININENAWRGHEGHGDVQLIDADGDGYVTSENECGLPVDCDDTDAELTDNCCEEGYEIDFEGPLFVALADEAGVYNWQGAKNACAAKAEADGCGWFLPSKDELKALYIARNDIGGFDPGSSYWSSTEVYDYRQAWYQNFNDGYQELVPKYLSLISCRCVRR